MRRERADAVLPSANRIMFSDLNPLESASPPGVKKTTGQNKDKYNPLEHHVQLQLLVGNRPREEKYSLDIKN